MSTLDEYEHRRGPLRRRRRAHNYAGRPTNAGKAPGHRVSAKEVQMQLRLMGGTTAKDKGQPFDDPIPF